MCYSLGTQEYAYQPGTKVLRTKIPKNCLGPQATSLQLQSATLFMLLTGCSFPQAHLALGINHKAIEDMFSRIAAARQAYVVEKQKSIVFGHEKSWVEVEADEATFQRTNVSKDVEYKDSAQEGKPILWEQWSGIMVRGKPTTLLLSRLAPPLTKSRAPGAGAIRKVDWQPLATKRLLNSHVVLHTDSAKSYKARVKGVLHDAVVHCKKKTQSPCGKKTQWRSPQYVRVVNHKLPNGKTLKVKAGTQHIDRAWRFLKIAFMLTRICVLAPGPCARAFGVPSTSTGCGVRISGPRLGILCNIF